MDLFSKDELLTAARSKQLPWESVSLTLGGVTKQVIVQGMTSVERDAWEKSLVFFRPNGQRVLKTENVRARLAVQCLVDKPGGSRIFSDDDAVVLGNLPATALAPIFDSAQKLSGISDGDIDELKKSSELAAGSGSPTS